ncbi:protein NODULATION SIGNALING PATHWAY 2-like [Pyrus communis]|uniref:protein NODULATION SIGNALING PATHWAY 2-like n=1 Tax=Pyrus communis TaxID=23211 RepID=UPI0035C14B8B
MDTKENEDNLFNRLALFFIQGLYNKSLNVAPEISHKPVVPGPLANIMSAFQMLQELSPYLKFAHFMANQAILKAMRGVNEIHVIDLDIMEGSQWPSLMVDLAMKGGPAASIRVTAFTVDDQQTVHQAGIRQLHDPQLHMPNRSFASVRTFLDHMRKLLPKIVVLVEEEFNFLGVPSMSFVEFFCKSVHHYTALSDSFGTSFHGLGYKTGLKQTEEVLGIKIVDSVMRLPCDKEERMLMWGDGFFASLNGGFKPIPFTCYNIPQANYLANLFDKGYSVQHHNCRLALCWKSRPMLKASVWLPITKLML